MNVENVWYHALFSFTVQFWHQIKFFITAITLALYCAWKKSANSKRQMKKHRLFIVYVFKGHCLLNYSRYRKSDKVILSSFCGANNKYRNRFWHSNYSHLRILMTYTDLQVAHSYEIQRHFIIFYTFRNNTILITRNDKITIIFKERWKQTGC